MELRHLRYLVAVAEEKNFSRAARRLGMAQPPLSQQIKDLEKEVGFEVFERTNRGVRVTLAGEGVIDDARRVLKSMQDLQSRSRLRSRGMLGTISVGVVAAMMNKEVGKAIRTFCVENPNVEVTLGDLTSNRQLELLLSGALDVAFFRVPQPSFSSLESEVVFGRRVRLAVPKNHPLAAKNKVTWADLAKERFILLQAEFAPDFYEQVYQTCRAQGFEPSVSQYVNSVPAILWASSIGLGVGLIPLLPEYVKVEGVVLIDLPEGSPVYEISMVWRRGERSEVVRKFVDSMRDRNFGEV